MQMGWLMWWLTSIDGETSPFCQSDSGRFSMPAGLGWLGSLPLGRPNEGGPASTPPPVPPEPASITGVPPAPPVAPAEPPAAPETPPDPEPLAVLVDVALGAPPEPVVVDEVD